MKTKTKKLSYRMLKQMVALGARINGDLEIQIERLRQEVMKQTEQMATAVNSRNDAVAEVGRIKNVLIEYFAAASNPTTCHDCNRLADLQSRICNQYVTPGCFADTGSYYYKIAPKSK